MKQKNKCRDGINFRPCRGGFHIRPEKGITLIALIITIIVMLILVAVTITVSLNGGLFNYARKAAKGTNEAIENEKLLAQGIINGQTIDDIVGIAVSDDWYGITEELTLEEGKTEYHITSCAELKKFSNAVNAGNDFAGITVYLDKNLDLKGNAEKQWTPIGTDWDIYFAGTFDGQNHFISGIYIDNDNGGYAGLFGLAGACEDTNIIKNLGIKNSYINTPNRECGGIVGYNCAVIQNCYNEAEIIGSYVGGIAGWNDYKILECYNSGKITGEKKSGGIAGDNEDEIIKCFNKGYVIAFDDDSSEVDYGAVGICDGPEGATDCYNIGKIEGAGSLATGISFNGSYNCFNIGKISGTATNLDEISISESTNSYFLSEDSTDERARTSAFMKSQEFVDLLNAGRTEADAVWKMDTNNINDGFPILYWQ